MNWRIDSAAVRKPVLLTGAGFTKSFGGFLANEMWAAVLNHTAKNPLLRELMLEHGDLDYEEIYDEVLDSDFSEADKSAFLDAVINAYADMNEAIAAPSSNQDAESAFLYFVSKFAGVKNQSRGFVFTLNQDLLAEEFLRPQAAWKAEIPGVGHQEFSGQFNRASYRVKLPERSEVQNIASDFNLIGEANLAYIKLHGSLGWKDSAGKERMVIGNNKSLTIRQEPLLRWYFEDVFKQVLSLHKRRLLVIGYGFGDEHVNKEIAAAIANSGLRLFVISPRDPQGFRESLLDKKHGTEIWRGLHRYEIGEVRDFYIPHSSHLRERGRRLFDALEE